jgi:tetratricopeptide (TPR) repeat protein
MRALLLIALFSVPAFPAEAGEKEDLAALVDAGNASFRAGRHREAAAFYRRALEIDAKCEPALLNLARAFEAMGDRALAVWALERALATFPERLDLREDLAALYGALGRFAEAQALLESALVLAPDRASTYWALGEVFARAGERKRAIVCLEAAARLGASERALFLLLGDLYLDLAMPIEALGAYFRAERAPGKKTPEDELRRGRAAEEAGFDDLALASYRAALSDRAIDKAEKIRALAGLFRLYIRKGERAEAREVFEAARAEDPMDPAIESMRNTLEQGHK